VGSVGISELFVIAVIGLVLFVAPVAVFVWLLKQKRNGGAAPPPPPPPAPPT
jgi:hypothetical protein